MQYMQKLCTIVCRCSVVLLYKNVLQNVIVVPMILVQSMGFTWWGPGKRDGSPPVGSEGKAQVGGLGRSPPEDEAKCENWVQFFTFSCRKFKI